MTVLLPRVDREQAQPLIDHFRGLEVLEVAERMPVTEIVTTISDLGGIEIDPSRLAALRKLVVAAAVEHGYPRPDVGTADTRAFEAHCARLLHTDLGISPHEAAEEQVWTHLTVCWLMDVAVWRWGPTADERRFRGDINRNAFRRLWWRAEVFGPDFDLGALGEDEFVNLMERPTIACNRRLARSIASAFLLRVASDPRADRMMLMRDTSKHVLRLMPIVDFGALSEGELSQQIAAALDAAATGRPLAPAVASRPPAEPSDCVKPVTAVTVPMTALEMASDDLPADIAELANVAVGIAQRVGRVTNGTLREALSNDLESADARRILQALVDRGELRKRGKAKGTYYVMPSDDDEPSVPVDPRRNDSHPHAELETLTTLRQDVGDAADRRATESVVVSDELREPTPQRPPLPDASRGRLQRPLVTPSSARDALRRFLKR